MTQTTNLQKRKNLIMARLLGSYKSNLSTYLYQEMIQILEAAIIAGDYGGGKLFDRSTLEELRLQGQEFDNLPLSAAGQRAYAESINYPMRLLQARFAAVVNETDDFLVTISKLLETLEKDTALAERLLRISKLDPWVAQQATLRRGRKFAIDLTANTGPIAATIPNTDPLTGITNSNKCQEVCFSYKGDPVRRHVPITAALTSDLKSRLVQPVTFRWHYEDGHKEVEELVGQDWSRISFIHDSPIIDFGPPSIETISPTDGQAGTYFRVTGRQNLDNLALYVRIMFVPRLRVLRTTATADLVLSQYRINRNEINIYRQDESYFYEEGLDYRIDDLGRIQPTSSMLNQPVTITFQEYFPGYQCSVNEVNWSPIVLFDPSSPYTDAETQFFPLDIKGNTFPLIDESTTPVGLYLEMVSVPDHEYLIKIQSSNVIHSATRKATLEIEFERMYMLNGIRLSSVSNFPLRVRRVYDAISYGGQVTRPIFISGSFEEDLILENELTLRFPKQELQRLFIEFHQENYTFKEHVLDAADATRHELLEGVLPQDASGRGVLTRRISGVQYEMSLQHLCGVDVDFRLPAVVTFGPFQTDNAPAVLKLNTVETGTIEYYFIDQPYDRNGNRITSVYEMLDPAAVHGVPIYPNLPVVYKSTAEEASRIDFYLKVVFRTADSLLEKFVLQAS